jgi:hypothetical protein
MTAAASSPPTLQSRSTIPTKQASSIVDSIETEVVLQTFQDKILVLVTQTSKIGSLVSLASLRSFRSLSFALGQLLTLDMFTLLYCSTSNADPSHPTSLDTSPATLLFPSLTLP